MKDQRETVHAYDYDKLGRQTQDRITALGSGVDGAVRRIETAYDVRGLRERITSYDNPTAGAGSVVNEVEAVYNDFSQLVTEYQEHSGAVNTSTSPKVQYAYANGADNHIRPTSLTYPDGRSIDYDYGTAGGSDDAASRVQTLKEGVVALAEYSYLGQQSVVEVDYTEPDLRFTLVDLAGSDDPDTGDIYSGLDRFGRVKDSRWYDYGSSADAERIKYGYDRAGNRTYREVTLDPGDAHDELYGYDGAHRLAEFDRGSLSGGKDAISSLEFAQQWSLDPTGNWSGFQEDADGDSTWDLDQSRSHNAVNEITGISETAGTAWATPGQDRAGNLTSLPQPAALAQSYTAVWDGWNRLVKLVDAGTSDTVQENEYDGRKFRIVRKDYVSGSLDETRHVYYTSRWQAIEERLGSSSDAERQTVWGLRYIDDVLLRDRDTSGNGTLDERLYALQDGNWNVTAVADDGGTVWERYAYTAYGRVKYLSGSFAARGSSSHAWEHLYTGRSLDVGSGLYTFRHRMYHPELGRWCSRDPIGYIDGRSLYAFGRVRPTIAADPTGNVSIIIKPGRQEATEQCGNRHQQQWTFILDRGKGPDRERCEGYFVQKVTVECKVEDCQCGTCASGESEAYSYYEAWYVGENRTRHHGPKGLTDQAFATPYDNTCGKITQKGEVRFYCIDETGDLGRLGKSGKWKVGQHFPDGKESSCSTGSGRVPATGDDPQFWVNDKGATSSERLFELEWNCCGTDPWVKMDSKPAKGD